MSPFCAESRMREVTEKEEEASLAKSREICGWKR
jgi:hypothetical protein